MTLGDIFFIIFIALAIIFTALYFLNRWAIKKYGSQQDIIEKSKMSINIFVIDKKKMRINDANFPKAIYSSIPKFYKFLKLPIVKAKVGNKIMDLICDKKVFKSIDVKKNCKVELAGIYIISLVKKLK